MSVTILIARLLHVGLGVFWAGTIFLMRPDSLRAGELGAMLPDTPEAGERDAILAEIAGLKSRSRTHPRWVSLWLGVAVLTMAVARYL